MDKHRQIVVAGAIGNTLEFYDFVVFAYLVPILGTLFFPSTDQLASILKAYALFAVGFVVRPFGGVVFGHFADRVGRKRMLQISIIVMAIPTAMIGCLPTYSQIGVKAHPHMLRHACGYALANKGHDTRALQAYLGHQNIQHTVRYTELTPTRFKDFWRG